MKLAIIGYGKMGRLIENLAQQTGDEIVYVQDQNFERGDIYKAKVAIIFSQPKSAVSNIEYAFNHNLNVICGTTGWLDNYEAVTDSVIKNKRGFMYASNFSIGVNILFELNRRLAQLMIPFENYVPTLKEIHHTEKLDAPSGTAINLAEGIIENSDYTEWSDNSVNNDHLRIKSIRKKKVVGTHKVNYISEVDEISIVHKAFKRDGFALGALLAARWIDTKVGVFSFKDVLASLTTNSEL